MDQKRMEQIGKILFDHKDNQGLEGERNWLTRPRQGAGDAWAPELKPKNGTEAPDVSLDPIEMPDRKYYFIGKPVDKRTFPLKIRYVRPRNRSRGRDGDVFIQPVAGQPPGINPVGEIPLPLINTPKPGWEKWPFEPMTESERIARTLYDHEDSIRLMQEAKRRELMERFPQGMPEEVLRLYLSPDFHAQQGIDPLKQSTANALAAHPQTSNNPGYRNSSGRLRSGANASGVFSGPSGRRGDVLSLADVERLAERGRVSQRSNSKQSTVDKSFDPSKVKDYGYGWLGNRAQHIADYLNSVPLSKSYKDWLGGMLGGANGDAPSFEGGSVEQNSPDPDHDADRH